MASESAGNNSTLSNYQLLEQEVFELEDYIKDIWEFIPVSIAYLNPAGIIMDVDSSMEKFLDIPREDLIGTRLTEYIKDPAIFQHIHQETLEHGGIQNIDNSIKTRSGAEIKVVVSSAVRRSQENEVVGYFISFSDTSKIKQIQSELEKKLAELKEFHDLAVGRELRMIELEKEVDSLLAELNRQSKYNT
ncbi:MAG: PAS domain-containing protein [Candidatus Saganbacteria bacterium]|nr:PAS domain-containing protein [Candidatus Saganbacteria bacterium]